MAPQHLDFLQEGERARGRNLFDEGRLVDRHRPLLVAQQRVVEADRVADRETVARVQRDALVAARQFDRTRDAQEPPGHGLGLDARLVNQAHERRGAAVHDRHLGVIQLDHDVVDAEADQRGQQVLDRFDRPLVLRQRRRVLGGYHVARAGLDLGATEVGPLEPDPGPCRRRTERQRDLAT
jgi:hypothetical protein